MIDTTPSGHHHTGQRGSALVLALFVLVLLTGMGASLLYLARTETRMADADVNGKAAFYRAEAGIETARTMLFEMNKHSPDPTDLTEELQALSGGDDVLDFTVEGLSPQFGAGGAIGGFAGYDDDVPLQALTAFADGSYVAFANNDPADGLNSVTDTNDRVLVTSVGVGPTGQMETVQAIVYRPDTFTDLPAAITILGPNPDFNGGKSNAKTYSGDDGGAHCPSGTGTSVPVVGVIGSAAEANAEIGVIKPNTFVSGTDTGVATVADLTTSPDLDPMWTDCSLLIELAQLLKGEADVIGDASTPEADLGTPGNPKIVFIDDDYDVAGGFHGAGILWVTGHLTFDGNAAFDGVIFIVGEGDFLRDGAGNGDIAGGLVVADISGPDRVLFTADDCVGEDGIDGTADDGPAQSSYFVNGAGNSSTGYCSSNFIPWQGLRPFKVVDFLQR